MGRAGAVIALLVMALPACGASPGGGGGAGAGPIRVVAAENFWGSIATQLGGSRVAVTSLITSPDADPHDYEPRAKDARAVASAGYVIYNGVGYDPWAAKLVAASGVPGRAVLEVGSLVGLRAGGNPHRWYSPPDVQRVVERITADYKRLDPAGAAYFDRQRATFESVGLQRYHSLLASIRQQYAGTVVGASESLFTPMAEALGLNLLTPASFLDAISQGAEPSARDKATVDDQLRAHRIKVYVFNPQNSTPDVNAQVELARAQGVPTVTMTETLTPVQAPFQDWQADQLQALQAALQQARAA